MRNRGQVTKNLDILVDFLDFGSFFTPQEHQEAHNALINAARRPGTRVRMLVCGFPEAEAPGCNDLNKFANLQYYEEKEVSHYLTRYLEFLKGRSEFRFRESIQKLTFEAALKKFSGEWFGNDKPTSDDIKHCICKVCEVPGDGEIDKTKDVSLFRTLLQVRQLWFAEDLQFAGVQIRGLSEAQSLFFWHKHEDEKDARAGDEGVFTFAIPARGKGQLGFITRDSDLLAQFGKTFEQKWGEAENAAGSPPWVKTLHTQWLLH